MFGSKSLLKLNGVIHARAPIIHGAPQGQRSSGDTNGSGNRTYGRRLKVIVARKNNEGIIEHQFEYIPVVSGNGIRGQCRRLLASHFVAALEINPGEVSKEVLYLLFCGGVLGDKKNNKSKTKEDEDAKGIDIETRQKIRRMLPMIDLLGGAYGGHILRGRLAVGFAVPMVKDLAPIYEGDSGEGLPSLEEFRRAAATSTNGLAYARHVDPDVIPVVLEEDLLEEEVVETQVVDEAVEDVVDEAVEEDEDAVEAAEAAGKGRRDKTPRALFSYEAIPMGTSLWHEFILDDADEVTRACFNFMLQKFFDWGHIGGKMSAGHGAFTAEYVASDGSPVPGDYSAYLDFITSHKAEIVDFLHKGLK